MIKIRAFLLFAATLIVGNNICLAIENTVDNTDKYPNYAREFTGEDKFENFNRKMFIFNSKVNKFVIRPANIVWASVMPKYGMERLQSAYENIEFPIRFASCLLQKDFKSSGQEALRFLTNTTLGLGGLYDPAKNRFNIEPKQEDMAQALAYHKVKEGPYLVLPVIPSANIRGHIGELLDCPLNPSSYIVGPIPAAVKAIAVLNRTTGLQPMIKNIDNIYADPYDIIKKVYGVEQYLKNNNFDRKEVFAKKTQPDNIKEVSSLSLGCCDNLRADIELNGYNPQSPVADSMRTALFDAPELDESIWSELSVWNRSFDKKIKTSFVNIDPAHPNYKYRYVLQKSKTSPLAIIYPSIGEGVMSHHCVVLAKYFYDEGYSVIIQGSTFHWEFVKSMPDGYRPGIPYKDAEHARIVTRKIIDSLAAKGHYTFERKVLVGTSFGALTALFVAQQEEKENTLDISNYISVNPPVEIFFALRQLDKNSQEWKEDPADIKLRAAIIAQKVLNAYKKVSDNDPSNDLEDWPFSESEAKMITGFIMQQKLSDVVFTIEKSDCSKKCCVYDSICNMSFDDYAEKYLNISQYQPREQFEYDTSLYSLADFLQTSKKYKIYHALDDYFVNREQLVWLKEHCQGRSVFLSNGGHLGFLYRKEFIDEFKKDIALKPAKLAGEL